ncbi:hypothetical protein FA15DRAFT_665759 [Coprinopsis marcescibilis]|uniref:Uncharacterized protein n=1 Tax=Coprinopsis marcescibilis TaxID=230819 RepID=A0A5C3L622_COPMA|nr:hypothetical protein FA15DRAFT_665759 [Coprinopsis marcescibilis]
MSPKFAVFLALVLSFASAAPIQRREVPQEHSHERFLIAVNGQLNLDNPARIVDSVFGLLGDAAAANGAGDITDPGCLQQAIADQAFTNAKAAGNVQGQVDALIYRALEKNTLRVGLVSEPCTSIQAVNPEIAAIQQHQDPASPNAAAVNKAIVLELAKQIKAVGGNPLDALLSGTFAPGDLNDATARGNSCNELDDPEGCIFTQNLLVPDASPEEIAAAADGVQVSTGAAASPTAPPAASGTVCPPQQTVTVTALPSALTIRIENGHTNVNTQSSETSSTPVATPSSTTSAALSSVSTRSVSGNLQRFSGALEGATAPSVTPGGRGFVVEGSDSFLNIGAALGRSCDIQHNRCANIANSAQGRAAGLSVGQCDAQNNACRAAIA